MSSSVTSQASVMKHYSCDPLSPCQSHLDLFRQSQTDSGLVPSTHDKPERKYPQWSQSSHQRQEDNEEEDEGASCSYWPPEDSIIHRQYPDLNVTVCPDHIQDTENKNGNGIMRNSYYQETTASLTQFSGFVPRWYIPSTTMYPLEGGEIEST